MRKKGLILIVVLLAVASLMAAMAYTSATVNNVASLKVVNTTNALLTLEPNAPWNWGTNMAGTKDKTAQLINGELVFELGKGVARDGTTPEFYGLQPNSSYAWNPLFTLRNKSAETINVKVKATGSYAQYVTFGICGEGTKYNPTWGNQGEALEINNIPKETNSGMQNIRCICVKIDIPSGHPVSSAILDGKIIVEAISVN